jgi:hypothetical protein
MTAFALYLNAEKLKAEMLTEGQNTEKPRDRQNVEMLKR